MTTVVSQPHRHVSKRSQLIIPKNHMFCVIVQYTSSLLLSTCSTEENVMTEILLTVLFVCFVALRPKSTAMVMAGRSVDLTTLFPGQA